MLPRWTGWPRGQGGRAIGWRTSLSAARLLLGSRPGPLLSPATEESPAPSRRCWLRPRGAGSVQAVLSEGPGAQGDLGSVRVEQICWGRGFSWEMGVARLGPLGLSPLPVCAHTLSSGPGWPFPPRATAKWGERRGGREQGLRQQWWEAQGGRGGRFAGSTVGSCYSSAQLASRGPSGPPSGSCPPIWAFFIGS